MRRKGSPSHRRRRGVPHHDPLVLVCVVCLFRQVSTTRPVVLLFRSVPPPPPPPCFLGVAAPLQLHVRGRSMMATMCHKHNPTSRPHARGDMLLSDVWCVVRVHVCVLLYPHTAHATIRLAATTKTKKKTTYWLRKRKTRRSIHHHSFLTDANRSNHDIHTIGHKGLARLGEGAVQHKSDARSGATEALWCTRPSIPAQDGVRTCRVQQQQQHLHHAPRTTMQQRTSSIDMISVSTVASVPGTSKSSLRPFKLRTLTHTAAGSGSRSGCHGLPGNR